MKSIRRKLTMSVIAALIAVLGAGGTAVYWAVREAHYDQFDASLRTKALVVITATEVKSGRVRVDFSDRFLREFDQRVATSFFQVWDDRERSVERSDSLRRRELPRRFGSMDEPKFWNLDLPGGRAGRAIGIGFRPRSDSSRRGEDERTAVVVVATGREELDGMLDRLLAILLGAGGAVLIVVAVTVPVVMSRGLRPLRRLADWADGMNARRLTERIPTDGLPAELRPICEHLNRLLARLGSSFERERRFSSNLAHELLTPVAELRTLAESALKWPEMSGPEAHQRSLVAALRMEGLITRLLELLRAEEGRMDVAAESVDLTTFVAEGWRPFAEMAAAKGLQIETSVPDRLIVETDPVLLRSILHNLLANAAHYSPQDGRIQIAAVEQAGKVIVTVSNSAPNLTPADLPNLFERLWRKDEARSEGGNHGLGLSLSREFAHLLGWRLEAALTEEGELRMELTGPVHGSRGGGEC